MLSLESISAVKVAVEICHIPKLKEKILFAHESKNDKHKGSWISKEVWMEIGNVIRSLDISENMQEKLLCLVSRIGMRMLKWLEYHEEILEFSRESSITFLTPAFFTPRGVIDRKKAAKELMNCEILSVKQRYVLSCIYCFREDINTLFQEMTDLDKRMFYDARGHENIKQPDIVKYWTYYQMDNIDRLTNEDVNAYKIKTAVRNGNIAAVEYFLQEMTLSRKDAIVEAAMEAIRYWQRKVPFTGYSDDYLNVTSEKINVPQNYYADILCYLLPRMELNEKIYFLKKDIEDVQFKITYLKYKEHSRVLECLLYWPYQEYFMKTMSVMWEFLPEWNYARLLLIISRKIKEGSQKLDGEGKSFDYKRLLRELWCQSHERYKMFILDNKEILLLPEYKIEAGVKLLTTLFSLPYFTTEDKENIEIIFSDATDKQKENIIFSKEWERFCIDLIEKEKWGVLMTCDLDCYFTKKARAKFKKTLSDLERVRFNLLHFIQYDKLNSAESFIKWTSLPEEEIKELKRDIIYSDIGMAKTISLLSYQGNIAAGERFIAWWFSSEHDLKLFKKHLIFSHKGISMCGHLILKHKFEFLTEFIRLCISSSDEIKEIKKTITYEFGYSIFKKFITDYYVLQYISSNRPNTYDIKMTSFIWEEIEKFITFCFSSEDEINDFKKNVVLKKWGKDIHFDFIKSSKWAEAETFFSWIGLSADEIKKLKKETLFYHGEAKTAFIQIMNSKESDAVFDVYGSKEEAMELLLRWYLDDKDTVLEFRDECKKWFRNFNFTDKVAVLKSLDSIIEQQLKDFDKELD